MIHSSHRQSRRSSPPPPASDLSFQPSSGFWLVRKLNLPFRRRRDTIASTAISSAPHSGPYLLHHNHHHHRTMSSMDDSFQQTFSAKPFASQPRLSYSSHRAKSASLELDSSTPTTAKAASTASNATANANAAPAGSLEMGIVLGATTAISVSGAGAKPGYTNAVTIAPRKASATNGDSKISVLQTPPVSNTQIKRGKASVSCQAASPTPAALASTSNNSSHSTITERSRAKETIPAVIMSSPILPSPGRRAGAPSHIPSFPPKAFTPAFDSPCLRLSPSIISRHKPMPILNLPIMPPPTPATSSRTNTNARRHHLRCMPALPLQGSDGPRDGDDDEGDDNDEDEDDDGAEATESPEDDDGDDDVPLSRPALPHIDRSRIDFSFILGSSSSSSAPLKKADKGKQKELSSSTGGISTTIRSSIYLTPRLDTPYSSANDNFDYFTSKNAHTESPTSDMLTPKPGTKSRAIDAGRADPLVLTPGGINTPRPSLLVQRRASKSMIDLLSFTKADQQQTHASDKPPDMDHHQDTTSAPSLPTDESPNSSDPRLRRTSAAPPYDTLRRRRSMPTFNSNTDPPPYPAHIPPFRHPHEPPSGIMPREDEGREQLPQYANDIYLRGIMPRKMEFLQPGVQAKDRKWRRVMCVLEGTMLKVYKCPASLAGVGVIGEWWEKTVGVGDSTDNATTFQKPKRREEREMKWECEGRIEAERQQQEQEQQERPSQEGSQRGMYSETTANRSKLNLAIDLLKSHHHRHRRSHSTDTRSTLSRPVAPSPRSSLQIPRSSSGHSIRSRSGSTVTPPPRTPFSSSATVSLNVTRSQDSSKSNRGSPSSSSPCSGDLPEPNPGDLIATYSLQHAESGLGNDYLKRKNVIRVRMDGEQFLLQAKDVSAVVEWIEGIHAGTNVALDLDERPMPRGPLFPRRRRRRNLAALQNPTNTVAVVRNE